MSPDPLADVLAAARARTIHDRQRHAGNQRAASLLPSLLP